MELVYYVKLEKYLNHSNFVRRTNSRIRESRENLYFKSATIEYNENSRILNSVKNPQIRN